MFVLTLNHCLLFPLRTGCIIIACINLIFQLKDNIDALKIFYIMGTEKIEDEGYIEHRNYALFHYIVKFIVSGFLVLVSIAIILAAMRKHPFLLKICAVIMVCSAFFPTLQSLVDSDPLPVYTYNLLAFVTYLFFGWVIWSYAVKLEKLQLPRPAYIQPPSNGNFETA